jgi:hypothetical protein
MRNCLIAIALLGLAAGAATPAQAGEHRLGFGFHYWKTVDELQDDGFDDIDDNGVSEVLSYQYLPSPMLRWEIDLEYFDKGFGGATERAYSPQVFLLFGRGIYAGVGVGATYSSGLADDWSDPYYAAKAGFDLLLLPKIHLDINANYQFDAWNQLDNVDTDTLTLGAIARFSF